MGRPRGEETRNSGRWTESQFSTFIRNQLRGATRKWAPIQDAKKKANTSRGYYLCAGCKEEVPFTLKDGRKRIANTFIDHIEPIVDPEIGFTNFDDFINRMFCEEDNLQLLCKDCHDKKSLNERAIAVMRRQKEREQDDETSI